MCHELSSEKVDIPESVSRSQEVYSKTGEAAGAPPEEETPSQDDPENTVEGEFREV